MTPFYVYHTRHYIALKLFYTLPFSLKNMISVITPYDA